MRTTKNIYVGRSVKPSQFNFKGIGKRLCSVFGCAKPVTHLFNDRCHAHQTINKPDAAMIAKHS